MSIGIWQLVLILAIILLLFGAGRIPRLMSDLGKGVKSFKKEVKHNKNDKKE
jgi:sec-independent protein translocase protein TatA